MPNPDTPTTSLTKLSLTNTPAPMAIRDSAPHTGKEKSGTKNLKPIVMQSPIGVLFSKQNDAQMVEASLRAKLPLPLALTITGEHVEESMPSPKRQRSISADYDILMANATEKNTVEEIAIEKLRADTDRHFEDGELKTFLSGLIGQLDLERNKCHSIIDDLLNNKTAVVEAQSQADRAVDLAINVNKRVDTITAEQRNIEDKLERMRRMNDVVISGLLLVGNERSPFLLGIVKKIADKINCPLVRRDIEHVRILSNRSNPDSTERLLLVRFSMISIRREFFMKYISVSDELRGSCIGRRDNDRIYIMDNLTGKNSEIRRKAAAMVRDGVLESYTVRDGLVFIKRSAKSSRTPIFQTEQLQSLFADTETETEGTEQYNNHSSRNNQSAGHSSRDQSPDRNSSVPAHSSGNNNSNPGYAKNRYNHSKNRFNHSSNNNFSSWEQSSREDSRKQPYQSNLPIDNFPKDYNSNDNFSSWEQSSRGKNPRKNRFQDDNYSRGKPVPGTSREQFSRNGQSSQGQFSRY